MKSVEWHQCVLRRLQSSTPPEAATECPSIISASMKQSAFVGESRITLSPCRPESEEIATETMTHGDVNDRHAIVTEISRQRPTSSYVRSTRRLRYREMCTACDVNIRMIASSGSDQKYRNHDGVRLPKRRRKHPIMPRAMATHRFADQAIGISRNRQRLRHHLHLSAKSR